MENEEMGKWGNSLPACAKSTSKSLLQRGVSQMEFINLTEDHSEDEVVCLRITAKIESNDEGMSPDDECNIMTQKMTERAKTTIPTFR